MDRKSQNSRKVNAGFVNHRWTVIRFMEYRKRNGNSNKRTSVWLCRCECGTEKERTLNEVVGHSKSCGCLRREVTGDRSRTHGLTRSRIYDVWIAMRARVENPSDDSYPNYGGRGIKVCKRWLSFKNFYTDMGSAPFVGATIERKDNNGDYSPDNCKWATRTEQNNNTRRNRFIEANGERLTLSQWGRKAGLSPQIVRYRLDAGWTPEAVLSTPLRPTGR